MAKGRMINKRLCKSKKYAKLTSDRSRVLYILLYTNTDRKGRVDGDPEEIKIDCCPYLKYTHRKIAESVIELHNVGLIKLYEIDDHPYIQFLEFEKHQPGLRKDREAKSEIPELVRSRSGVTPALYLSLSLSLSLKNHDARARKARPPTPQIDFNFTKGKFENITNDDIVRWMETYPAADIDLELKKMEDWLLSNPKKRKSNYRRFISNWLRRCQDGGGTRKHEIDQERGKTIGRPIVKTKSSKQVKYDNAREIKERELVKKHSAFKGEQLEIRVRKDLAKWSREYWGEND